MANFRKGRDSLLFLYLWRSHFCHTRRKKNHALLNPNYDITFEIIQIMKQSQNYDIVCDIKKKIIIMKGHIKTFCLRFYITS